MMEWKVPRILKSCSFEISHFENVYRKMGMALSQRFRYVERLQITSIVQLIQSSSSRPFMFRHSNRV